MFMFAGVGVLGMVGATAYGGLVDVLRPNDGETIFVSAASGAVGGLVGMLAKKLYNCKVIGSCGSDEKVKFISDLYQFDAGINYRTFNTAESLTSKLKEYSPTGIDMYFENVGGIHFAAAMECLRPRGRVAICGIISQYNELVQTPTPFYPGKMIYTSQRIEGFLSSTWLRNKTSPWLLKMHGWLRDGTIPHIQETVTKGIDNWPAAFESLFTGSNLGKVVVMI